MFSIVRRILDQLVPVWLFDRVRASVIGLQGEIQSPKSGRYGGGSGLRCSPWSTYGVLAGWDPLLLAQVLGYGEEPLQFAHEQFYFKAYFTGFSYLLLFIFKASLYHCTMFRCTLHYNNDFDFGIVFFFIYMDFLLPCFTRLFVRFHGSNKAKKKT